VVLTPAAALPCVSVPVVVAPAQLIVERAAAATSFRQRTDKPRARKLSYMPALLLPKYKLRESVPLTVLLQ
jgi:hypothetical protein